MEVRDQRVHRAEPEARQDEQLRVALGRARPCSVSSSKALSSARTVVVPTASTRPPRSRQSLTASAVQVGTRKCSVWMWWSCGSSSLTGRNVSSPTSSSTRPMCAPSLLQAVEQRLREMQPRRRRRRAALVGAEHRLVVLGVLERPGDVGRERHLADAVHDVEELALLDRELDQPAADSSSTPTTSPVIARSPKSTRVPGCSLRPGRPGTPTCPPPARAAAGPRPRPRSPP